MDKSQQHSQAKIIAKNSVALIVARISDFLFGFIFIKLSTNYLGKITYGDYTYLSSIVCVIIPFASFGLQRILIREMTSHDKSMFPKYFTSALVIKGTFSILSFIVVLILSYKLNISSDLRIVFIIIALSEIIAIFFLLAKTVFTAFEVMKYEAYTTIALRAVGIVLIVGAIYFKFGLLGVVVALLLHHIFGVIIGMYVVIKKFGMPSFHIDFELVKYIFIQSLPMFIILLLTQAFLRVDVFIIKTYRGSAEVGLFAAPYNLVVRLQTVVITILTPVFPLIIRLAKNDLPKLNSVYKVIYRFLFMLTLPISIVATVYSRNIILFFTSPEFEASYMALQVLIWIIVISFIEALNNFVVIAVKKQWFTSINYVFLFLFNFLLGIFLVPRYGFIGACWGTLLSYFIIYINTYTYLYFNNIRINLITNLSKPLLSAVIMAILLYFIKDIQYMKNVNFLNKINLAEYFNITISASIFFAGYVGLLLLTKSFSPKEIQFIKGLKRSKE